jgi:DNA-binding MarR family transcriptional regulator
MEEKGLIRRQADLQDKRKVLIFLTQEGIDKRRIAKHVVLDFNERLVANIPKGKLKTFFEVAERLDTTIDIELNNI